MSPVQTPTAAYATFEQAQDYTTLGRTSLEKLIREKRLTARKIGRRVVIAYKDLDALIASMATR
jgi:excisionase family DNA binding protein